MNTRRIGTIPDRVSSHNKGHSFSISSSASFSDWNSECHSLHLRQLLKCSFWFEMPNQPSNKASIHCLGMFIYVIVLLNIYLYLGQGSECQCLPPCRDHEDHAVVDNVVMDVRLRKPMWHECGSSYKKWSWSLVRSMTAHRDPLLSRTEA